MEIGRLRGLRAVQDGATNKNDTYFAAANTGIVTSTVDNRPAPPTTVGTTSGGGSLSPTVCPEGDVFDTTTGRKCSAWTNTAPSISITPVSMLVPFNDTIAYAMGTAVIKLGSKGNSCKVWQLFFNTVGARLTADGNCGPLTMAFAKTWQKSLGLTADGNARRKESRRG